MVLVELLVLLLGKTGDRREVSGFVRLGYFLLVARFARVIALDTARHVTQRGNAFSRRMVNAASTSTCCGTIALCTGLR